jgi:hypothetical protein
VDLLVAGVLVADRQLLKIPYDVVSRPGIHVPVCVHTIGGGCHYCCLMGGPVKLGSNLL